MTKKFPIVATIVCLGAVSVLGGLGTWQVQRLEWKNQLQAELDLAFAEKIPQPFTTEKISALENNRILRGFAEGQLDWSKAIEVHGRIELGRSVRSVVVPFILADENKTAIAVEVGCSDQPDISAIRALNEPRSVKLIGVIRQPKWSFAVPANDVAKDEWWRIEASQLSAYWQINDLVKPVMTVENTADIVPQLTACLVDKKLRNDHLNYAAFWFTMAGVLIGMWVMRFLKPYLQSA